MKRSQSPALVISIIALFVALGGTGYAAVKINGKNIKKGTVSGSALKKNSLTGTQIKESKLGKVPAAATADTASSATTAGDSAKLGGLGASAFAKGDSRFISKNVIVDASSSRTILEVPGVISVVGSCNGTDQLSLALNFDSNNLAAMVSTHPSGASVFTTGGAFGESDDLGLGGPHAAQRYELSVWRTNSVDEGYELSGAALGCKASSRAVGKG